MWIYVLVYVNICAICTTCAIYVLLSVNIWVYEHEYMNIWVFCCSVCLPRPSSWVNVSLVLPKQKLIYLNRLCRYNIFRQIQWNLPSKSKQISDEIMLKYRQFFKLIAQDVPLVVNYQQRIYLPSLVFIHSEDSIYCVFS